MRDPKIDQLRHDRTAMIHELESAGAKFPRAAADGNPTCFCPFHDNKKTPAGSVYEGDNGVWRFKCHSCGFSGDVIDVMGKAQGLDPSVILKSLCDNQQTPAPASSNPTMLTLAKVAFNAFTDEQRQELADDLGVSPDALRSLKVGRMGADELRRHNVCADQHAFAWTWPMRNDRRDVIGIRLRFPDGSKKSITGSKQGIFIPAEPPDSDGRQTVVEGETDVAASLDMGCNAIGRPSNASGQELVVEYCRRHPQPVVIIHDRDEKDSVAKQTKAAANRLAEALVPIVPKVRVIQPPEPFKDVRAWHNAGATEDDLDAILNQTPVHGPGKELADRIDSITRGEYKAIDWPWRLLGETTQALVPGSITLVAGDPGATKSFLLLWAAAWWHEQGTHVELFELEKDRAFHLQRLLAQRAEESRLTDLAWMPQNADLVSRVSAEHQSFIESFGSHVTDAASADLSINGLIKWIEKVCHLGARVVIVDPVTLANAGPQRWVEDATFMREAGQIVTRFGASLIVATHPPKGAGGKASLDHLAGGTAYVRAADTVLWLERYDESKAVALKLACQLDRGIQSLMPIATTGTINRCMHILKARNGRGAGWRLGYFFEGGSLRFDERGILTKEDTGSRKAESA